LSVPGRAFAAAWWRWARWLRQALPAGARVAWLALVLGWAATPAVAHEFSMAEVELRQVGPAEFAWHWGAGNRTGENVLRPRWPTGCHDDNGLLRCGSQGLSGRLVMEGVGDRFSAVLLRVHWADGQMRVYTLTRAQPSVQLFGSADDRRGSAEVAQAYGVLGVQHILSGIDHLLFVVCLLFLVGFNRQLVWTITAFTLAHSVTLALSTLGLLTLRPPPVEATIALSIVLVAAEALHRRPTAARRWPALVALIFGLVHGLGFAGALTEIGLPDSHFGVALLSFNLGVEAGQLLVVLLAWALFQGARRLGAGATAWWPKSRVAALYVIGGLAAWWTLERGVAILA
jgi:hydrogenase/urease accessory protein HupE